MQTIASQMVQFWWIKRMENSMWKSYKIYIILAKGGLNYIM